ncbi:hypothetical protein O0L34_g1843 [Tuta absoluta]|nr:hypothetical protein O0L34_g1843 [Tuta absoluta]
MIPDNVTLVVKAPNQQIEDQNIECQSSWTVRQLKGHLSEVYPSKPSADEQKIIYSGQLLNDNSILKDVLRTYESLSVHTMHLVCTPKRRMMPEPKPMTPSTADSELRRRNVPVNTPNLEVPPVENRPETRQNDQNHTVEMQNYLSSFVNNYGRVPPYPNYNMGEGYLPMANDPAMMANHMMMMQQAYLQYMQQYANMWQHPATTAAPPPPETPAPAPPAEDEDGVARDWLDHLYAASRLAVLFSLVYLYGSPARLLLVMLLCAAGYLHQIGFFRDLQLNPQEAVRAPAPDANANGNVNNVNVNADVNVGNADANVNAEADNVNINANNVNVAANNVNAEGNNVNANTPPVNIVDEQRSLLAVTWMVFTSFFASLIPDTN